MGSITEIIYQTRTSTLDGARFRGRIRSFEGREVRISAAGGGFLSVLQGRVTAGDVVDEFRTLGNFLLGLRKYDGPFTLCVEEI